MVTYIRNRDTGFSNISAFEDLNMISSCFRVLCTLVGDFTSWCKLYESRLFFHWGFGFFLFLFVLFCLGLLLLLMLFVCFFVFWVFFFRSMLKSQGRIIYFDLNVTLSIISVNASIQSTREAGFL